MQGTVYYLSPLAPRYRPLSWRSDKFAATPHIWRPFPPFAFQGCVMPMWQGPTDNGGMSKVLEPVEIVLEGFLHIIRIHSRTWPKDDLQFSSRVMCTSLHKLLLRPLIQHNYNCFRYSKKVWTFFSPSGTACSSKARGLGLVPGSYTSWQCVCLGGSTGGSKQWSSVLFRNYVWKMFPLKLTLF